jgi:uroporphyrinogen decarboxylase
MLSSCFSISSLHAPSHYFAPTQAGRYLPEFRAVRAEQAFFKVCRTPSLAMEVTVQPIDRFPDLDASIIFSDILVIPQALGFEVDMVPGTGPSLPRPLRTVEDIQRLDTSVPVDDALSYVYDAIAVTRHALGGRVPLIGFCGGPWTLFAYMVDGGGSRTFQHSKSFLYQHPEEAKHVLQTITDACVAFLVGQARAGAQMLQVFESNAGELSPEVFAEFALPYLAQIASRVKAQLRAEGIVSEIKEARAADGTIIANDDIPMTCFARAAPHALSLLAALEYDTFSLDWAVEPQVARAMVASPKVHPNVAQWVKPHVGTDKARSVTLQGNLEPCTLYAPEAELTKRVESMVKAFGPNSYIANLGHGMMPTHPPEGVAIFAKAVHNVSKELIKKQE